MESLIERTRPILGPFGIEIGLLQMTPIFFYLIEAMDGGRRE